ncbi:hypothetical protein ACEQPO_09580 [Bacillus sp. SL00103]
MIERSHYIRIRAHYQFLHDEEKRALILPMLRTTHLFQIKYTHEEPAFIHKHMSQQEMCEQAEEQEVQKNTQTKESASYKERGGFRFPTGKQIISQTNDSYEWQEPRSIQFSDALHLEENEQAHTIDLFPHITFSTP